MGNRYYLNVKCPFCGYQQDGVYYAPTSGFMTHDCEKCGKTIDLEEYSGINAELTASTENGIEFVRKQKKEMKKQKRKTKEELEKGCGKKCEWSNQDYLCGQMEDLKHSDHIILCKDCQEALKIVQEIN